MNDELLDPMPADPTPAADLTVANPWEGLRQLTPARIALGRTGVSLPTQRHLAFQLAHARARDAVHLPLDVALIQRQLAPLNTTPVVVHSAAANRVTYLQRPDWGRRLDDAARQRLQSLGEVSTAPYDVVFVMADGLSARAIHDHAVAFYAAARVKLPTDWRVGPLVVVEQGRVAIGDEIGALLGATLVVVLIGERPGLSAPDSLGAYLTYEPRVGRTDAERNCLSNIRPPEGLSYAFAAHKLAYLLVEARRRQLSGVDLKDDVALTTLTDGANQPLFLLASPSTATP